MTVKDLHTSEYQTHLDIPKFRGMNTYNEHTDIDVEDLRDSKNLVILSNGNMVGRNGSQFLKATGGTKRGTTAVLDNVVWDVGDEEYLITQEGTSFYSQALLTPGNPTLIAHTVSGAFTVSSTDQADMVLSGDKLFIFHNGGNKIIEWNGSAFTGRSMGMDYPVILAVSSPDSGQVTGKYTWGIEKVYQVGGVDKLASTPNRKNTSRVVNSLGTIASKKVTLTIQSTELDNDTLWTHIRLWRSKNQNTNYDDVQNPIDASGLPEELYEVALITKAEIEAVSLTAIATGTSLPVGNTNVTAGKPSSVYTITDNCLDEELGELVDLDRIELVPLPPANTGASFKNKIWVADVNDSNLDDDTGDNIYYSLYAGTKYAEQYDRQNFVKTNRDGQAIKKLVSFENDLLVFKEGKTGRVVNGDVALDFDILDHKNGLIHKNMAEYIPGVGVFARTTENSDFKIFGYDYTWSSYLHGNEISKSLRTEASALTPANVSIRYLNGNVLVSDGTGTIYCLNAEQRKGWTKHVYPANSLTENLFTFANGARGGIVSQNTHLVEIDVDGVETDINTAIDDTDQIEVDYTTFKYRHNDGAHLVEYDSYTVMGKFKYDVHLIPFVNGVSWPLMTSDTQTRFTATPNLYTAQTALRDKEYRCYIEPATIGSMKWQIPVGNYLHFKVKTYAPCTIRTNKLWCTIDEEIGTGEFDPFQLHGGSRVRPDWDADVIQETGTASDTIQETGSASDTIQEGT